jgi:hypothetical protein
LAILVHLSRKKARFAAAAAAQKWENHQERKAVPYAII